MSLFVLHVFWGLEFSSDKIPHETATLHWSCIAGWFSFSFLWFFHIHRSPHIQKKYFYLNFSSLPCVFSHFIPGYRSPFSQNSFHYLCYHTCCYFNLGFLLYLFNLYYSKIQGDPPGRFSFLSSNISRGSTLQHYSTTSIEF